MLTFLAGLTEPIATVCFVADDQGDPVLTPYEEVLAKAQGSDPFSIPNGATPDNNADFRNLLDARFLASFRARLGVPPAPDPSKLPDLVVLGADTAAVQFNMLCSEFSVAAVHGGLFVPLTWSAQSQDPSSPWVFTTKVDMRLSTVDGSAYSKLPADVQQRIKNLSGSAFSVQQLLFDLTNAALETVPTISGVAPGSVAYTLLEQYFVGAYFTEMQKQALPILGCSVSVQSAPPSTLTLTDLNFNVNPYEDPNGQPYPNPTPDQQQAATLNYLCAANHNQLPPAVSFNWNWLDTTQMSDHDGVMAINRNTLANYFKINLAPMVPPNCILVNVDVSLDSASEPHYNWTLTGGQKPNISQPLTGQTVLSFSYSSGSQDDAGLDGDIGAMDIRPSYVMNVDFVGNTVVITQHIVIYVYVRHLQTSGSANMVDKQIVDTFTIGVDAQGRLTTTKTSKLTDNSSTPSVNPVLDFFTNVNQLFDDVSNHVSGFQGSQLTDPPVSIVQDFVFPGGNTFTYKNAAFSDFQDLVSYITYTDPLKGKAGKVTAPVHSATH